MAIRGNIEYGYPDTVKTYATPERCRVAIEKLVARFEGGCNIRIVPIETKKQGLRYTAIGSCFENLQEGIWLAWQGFFVSN